MSERVTEDHVLCLRPISTKTAQQVDVQTRTIKQLLPRAGVGKGSHRAPGFFRVTTMFSN